MANAIPKRVLLSHILKNMPESQTRDHFRLKPSTRLKERLNSFSKPALEEFLRLHPEADELFSTLEARYPLEASRTLFIPKTEHIDTEYLLDQADKLSERGIDEAFSPSQQKDVGLIYIEDKPTYFDFVDATEITLKYHQRFEYTVADTEMDDYGEKRTLYSLESALVWIFQEHSHAIICCSGVSVARALIQYVRFKLGVKWWLPNLTDEMFRRLTEGTQPSTTTYHAFSPNVPTVTVSARGLDSTDLYQQFEQDEDREAMTSFGRNPDSTLISFGVAKRNARVWTPYKFPKITLLSAAKEIASKTDEHLSDEYQNNLKSYVSYFGQAPIFVKSKDPIKGRVRQVYLDLAVHILRALRSEGGQTTISSTLVQDLVEFSSLLDLNVSTHFDCDNCGGGLARCHICLSPLEVSVNGDSQLDVTCPQNHLSLVDSFVCECGNEIQDIDIGSALSILPGEKLAKSINEFFSAMDEVDWQHVFMIDGGVVKVLVRRVSELPKRVYLRQLQLWRNTARHHVRVVTKRKRTDYLRVLTLTKEKCNRGQRLTRELCDNCIATQISSHQVRKENELCLARILGISIGLGFDGIHHGHEIADVRYEDRFLDTDTDRPVRLGIHLKSRHEPRTQGLGRSIGSIKGLYTQAFYSAYLALRGDVAFDVIGISIPNTIHDNVIDSISDLLYGLGFSLLVIDESEWLKILDSAIETIEFAEIQQ